MSTFTPIFDRTGLQVSWMLNRALVHDLQGKYAGSIQSDGSIYADGLYGEYLGCFSDYKFFDPQGFVVAFLDPTLAQNEQPTHQNCVSPVLANAITNWSNRSWSDFWPEKKNKDLPQY